VKSVTRECDSLQGGISQGIFACGVVYEEDGKHHQLSKNECQSAGLPLSVVFKASPGSINLKQGREAEYFNDESEMRQALACLCANKSATAFPTPKIFASLREWGGNPQGIYILMEDIRRVGVRADQFHGAQGGTQKIKKGEGSQTSSDSELKSEEMWRLSFEYAAKTHARFMGRIVKEKKFNTMALGEDEGLLKGIQRLKYADWLMGSNKQGFEKSIKDCMTMWQLCETSWMDQRLAKLIQASIETTNFEKAVTKMRSRPLTLVHGDFHAKNLFYMKKGAEKVLALDFSEIGVGDPFSDLLQYTLSDVSIETRRKHEQDVLKAYWKRLTAVMQSTSSSSSSKTKLTTEGVGEGKSAQISSLVSQLTFERVVELYKSGLDRWLYFLPMMAFFDGCTKQAKAKAEKEKKGSWSPPSRTVYFHDAIKAFVEDHCKDTDYFVLRGACEVNLEAFLNRNQKQAPS